MADLPVFEMFYSLQGEGSNAGTAAYFIRLAGCNVCCDFCDEKRAWQTSDVPLVSVRTILDEVKKASADTVIVTGGEPTMYDLSELTETLHGEGIKTFIETSGVNEITGIWDWITVSPKQNKLPLRSSLLMADEIKTVIAKENDFLFAERMLSCANAAAGDDKKKKLYYLQAEFSQKDKVLPLIIDYIKRNPVWRLSLQTHKMINIR
ncbi:MAG: radical SAM protein [Bacteroidales bacterium]|nr:radical SAM protein [Bacteroidales bacterium]